MQSVKFLAECDSEAVMLFRPVDERHVGARIHTSRRGAAGKNDKGLQQRLSEALVRRTKGRGACHESAPQATGSG